ncbi:MAG: molybdopterin converting factor subunit 1 [Chloroflexi bacterium]|nr:molybdopterin converting factor subunit 1 [Chloroflexota bacterium]MBI3732962.1 molybdopterin converting factor subunit 1 [Chloroflexota bacterium]
MKVKVKLFAAHRQLLGRRELELEVPSGATVMAVWQQLKAEQPPLAHLSDTLVAAVNQDYASLDAPLKDGDEVAFIPPVSGGAHV